MWFCHLVLGVEELSSFLAGRERACHQYCVPHGLTGCAERVSDRSCVVCFQWHIWVPMADMYHELCSSGRIFFLEEAAYVRSRLCRVAHTGIRGIADRT
mmetsp:Transcript_17319/g.41425  ORF Transcript_17319/g.41425 Transcript_17319/m.41425 type:complete len:99 (-) Transcript_17319:98-394(-)